MSESDNKLMYGDYLISNLDHLKLQEWPSEFKNY